VDKSPLAQGFRASPQSGNCFPGFPLPTPFLVRIARFKEVKNQLGNEEGTIRSGEKAFRSGSATTKSGSKLPH
jgi:hypothetical protein